MRAVGAQVGEKGSTQILTACRSHSNHRCLGPHLCQEGARICMLLGPQSVHLSTDQATKYCRQNELLVQCQYRTADASLAVPASRRWQTAAPPSLFQGFARMKSSAHALWDPCCDGLHGRPLEGEQT